MSSGLTDEAVGVALAKYDLADETIANWAETYGVLQIRGVKDSAGFEAVHAGRMFIKARRVDVEHTRKELKADALAFGKAVDKEAKRITKLLTPIEEGLGGKEAEIKAIRERQAREAEEERKEKIRGRLERLQAVGVQALSFDIEPLSDEDFDTMVLDAAEEFRVAEEAREVREAEEEEKRLEREAEDKRLRKERAKLEKDRGDLEAKKRLDKKLLEDQQRAIRGKAAADQKEIDATKRWLKKQKDEVLEKEKAEKEAKTPAPVETPLEAVSDVEVEAAIPSIEAFCRLLFNWTPEDLFRVAYPGELAAAYVEEKRDLYKKSNVAWYGTLDPDSKRRLIRFALEEAQ